MVIAPVRGPGGRLVGEEEGGAHRHGLGAGAQGRGHVGGGADPARRHHRQPGRRDDVADEHGQGSDVRRRSLVEGAPVSARIARLHHEAVDAEVRGEARLLGVGDRDEQPRPGAAQAGEVVGLREAEREADPRRGVAREQVDLRGPVVVVRPAQGADLRAEPLDLRCDHVPVGQHGVAVHRVRVGDEQVDAVRRGAAAQVGEVVGELRSGAVARGQEPQGPGRGSSRHERGRARSAGHRGREDGELGEAETVHQLSIRIVDGTPPPRCTSSTSSWSAVRATFCDIGP